MGTQAHHRMPRNYTPEFCNSNKNTKKVKILFDDAGYFICINILGMQGV